MTPRPLLLVGGGGLAREVLAAVRLLPEKWKPIGALDDDASRHGARSRRRTGARRLRTGR